MKKVLLSLLTLALTLGSCNQEPESYENKPLNSSNEVNKRGWITLEQSKTSAVNYLNNQNKFDARNSNIPKFTERDIEESFGILDDNDNTLIYVHNLRNGGHIMMSGSVYEVPVLAYSNESKFSHQSLPDDLSLWLFLGSKKIEYLQRKGSSYKQKTNWSSHLGLVDQWGTYHPIPEYETTIMEEYDRSVNGPLLNATWGQGIGYNAHSGGSTCTFDNIKGSKTWAGCVPVAMGQIMHYHQWPNSFNWSSMPNRLYNSNLNTPGQNNIALLLRHLGNQLAVDWGCDGTSASVNNVKGVFNLNSYNASNPIDYSFDLVKAQTNQNRPVYMNGANKKNTTYLINWKVFGTKIKIPIRYSYEGHAWVADGTKEHVVVTKVKDIVNNKEYITTNVSKYIHFNWGWTEVNNPKNYNGWYYYDLFTPGYDTDENNLINYDDTYISSHQPFNMKRKIIINITPN